MYLMQQLQRSKMRTRNASSAAVALLTELQERAILHAVCWITQSPNATSVPLLVDDKHERTPGSKWFYHEFEDINVCNNIPTVDDGTIGSLQEPRASTDNRREMHCEMKNHNVNEVGSNVVPPNYWNLSGKEKFHYTQRLYSILTVSLLNFNPMQHSLEYDKF